MQGVQELQLSHIGPQGKEPAPRLQEGRQVYYFTGILKLSMFQVKKQWAEALIRGILYSFLKLINFF